jgi:hypothetical protein
VRILERGYDEVGHHLWAGLALGVGLLARRPAWQGPTIAALAIFQGIF